ncbi:interleukin-13 isoform 2 precursor [Gallus gallus]|uniref:Interleukin 13 n=1 Tax=Gallus gallus TaxID=9031 RepID=R4GKT8_CHICK|nr:interleukin-13 isoform 2 precursor [Gallus gallus]
MHRTLKAALALLCLAELVASTPLAMNLSKLKLSDITQGIQKLNRGVQLSEQELLCQAATVLDNMTDCKKDYEPLITSLKSLHGMTNCPPSTDNEIYLRNFLPALGNYTQALYRRISATAAN